MNLVDKSLKINFANESLVKDNERERERRRQMALFASVPYLSQGEYSKLNLQLTPEKPGRQHHPVPESCLMFSSPQQTSNKFFKGYQNHISNPFSGKTSQFSLFGPNQALEDF